MIYAQYTPAKPITGGVDAFTETMALLCDPHHGIISSVDDIGAVGHRIAHGGDISKAHVIDSTVRRSHRPNATLLLNDFLPAGTGAHPQSGTVGPAA